MGTLFAVILAFAGLEIYRRRGGANAQRALDRQFAHQTDSFRSTWPILAIIVSVNVTSLVIMFYLATPEFIQVLAVLGFAGSAVAGMAYVSFALLNGLFGRR